MTGERGGEGTNMTGMNMTSMSSGSNCSSRAMLQANKLNKESKIAYQQ